MPDHRATLDQMCPGWQGQDSPMFDACVDRYVALRVVYGREPDPNAPEQEGRRSEADLAAWIDAVRGLRESADLPRHRIRQMDQDCGKWRLALSS